MEMGVNNIKTNHKQHDILSAYQNQALEYAHSQPEIFFLLHIDGTH